MSPLGLGGLRLLTHTDAPQRQTQKTHRTHRQETVARTDTPVQTTQRTTLPSFLPSHSDSPHTQRTRRVTRESRECHYTSHTAVSQTSGSRSRVARLCIPSHLVAPCAASGVVSSRRCPRCTPPLSSQGTCATCWTACIRGAAPRQWPKDDDPVVVNLILAVIEATGIPGAVFFFGLPYLSFLTRVLNLSAPVFRLLCVVVNGYAWIQQSVSVLLLHLGLVGQLDSVHVPVDLNMWTLLHLAVQDDNGGTAEVRPPCGSSELSACQMAIQVIVARFHQVNVSVSLRCFLHEKEHGLFRGACRSPRFCTLACHVGVSTGPIELANIFYAVVQSSSLGRLTERTWNISGYSGFHRCRLVKLFRGMCAIRRRIRVLRPPQVWCTRLVSTTGSCSSRRSPLKRL